MIIKFNISKFVTINGLAEEVVCSRFEPNTTTTAETLATKFGAEKALIRHNEWDADLCPESHAAYLLKDGQLYLTAPSSILTVCSDGEDYRDRTFFNKEDGSISIPEGTTIIFEGAWNSLMWWEEVFGFSFEEPDYFESSTGLKWEDYVSRRNEFLEKKRNGSTCEDFGEYMAELKGE